MFVNAVRVCAGVLGGACACARMCTCMCLRVLSVVFVLSLVFSVATHFFSLCGLMVSFFLWFVVTFYLLLRVDECRLLYVRAYAWMSVMYCLGTERVCVSVSGCIMKSVCVLRVRCFACKW